jgi:hypothetical protein
MRSKGENLSTKKFYKKLNPFNFKTPFLILKYMKSRPPPPPIPYCIKPIQKRKTFFGLPFFHIFFKNRFSVRLSFFYNHKQKKDKILFFSVVNFIKFLILQLCQRVCNTPFVQTFPRKKSGKSLKAQKKTKSRD